MDPSRSLHASTRALAFALLAVFWVAQLSGLAHAISHVGTASEMDGLAPHALVCTSCVAAADAGAAPMLVAPRGALSALAATTLLLPPPAAPGREPAADYRPRAPPAAPI